MFDLSQLRCFVAVAEELHFGRAAVRLNMTQPPLSRQVQLLEHIIGAMLLERTSRSVRLTPAGRSFLPEAKRILRLAESAAEVARRIAAGKTGSIKIGYTAVTAYSFLPRLVTACRVRFPDIDLSLKEMVSGDQIEALSSGQIDVGLLRPPVQRPEFESVRVASESLLAAIPEGDERARKREVKLADFDKKPFVMYSPFESRYFHDLLTAQFAKANVLPQYVQHLGQIHSIIALVRAGLGASIVPQSAASLHFEGVALRPLKLAEPAKAELDLVWRLDTDHPMVPAFVEIARGFGPAEALIDTRSALIDTPIVLDAPRRVRYLSTPVSKRSNRKLRMPTMTRMTPREMAKQIGSGLLSFPVTPFKSDYSFDEATYRTNMDWLCGYDVAGLFAAGGTGEFFSLTPEEVARVTTVAVEETKGRVPVLAGAGYGTAIATGIAQAAEKAGADGLLLLPPYLVHSEQDGLAAHVEAVCKSTALGVIVYNRDNAMLTPETLAALCDRCPNLVGYKDGVGDIELMTRVYSRMGDRLTYVGGLPTAETFALPYLEMGVTTYSSAVFNFVPAFATAFYAAVRRRDRVAVNEGLNKFILPLIELRNRRKGYPVSIIKAGMRVIGRDSGPVRPPLTDLTTAELAELAGLVADAAKIFAPARDAAE